MSNLVLLAKAGFVIDETYRGSADVKYIHPNSTHVFYNERGSDKMSHTQKWYKNGIRKGALKITQDMFEDYLKRMPK